MTFRVPQESRSPAGDAPEPRRSAFEPAGSGQEKLDFNRNLKEGGKRSQGAFWDPFGSLRVFPELRDGPSRGAELWDELTWLSSPPCPCPCPPVMPTIEKLLSSDWKERLLGRNTAESKEVKGGIHLQQPPSGVPAGNAAFPTIAGGRCLCFTGICSFFN